MSRECRKCGKYIPYQVKINGQTVHLQNRKFCLECSPYRGQNTSPYDPIRRKARNWKDYSEEQKTRVKLSLYYRALRIRDELYQKHGGKCKVCGYDKCKRALSFHHRDPSQKLFGLTMNNLWCKNRIVIDEEANKCDLLCSNCHAEVEDEIARKTSIVKLVNLKYNTNF